MAIVIRRLEEHDEVENFDCGDDALNNYLRRHAWTILPVGTVDVMAVLDPIDDRAELAAKLSGQTDPEDLADLVRGQAPQPQLAGTLKHFVNGKMPFEDEVERRV